MLKSLLLFGGIALLLVGCATDSPVASGDAQAIDSGEAAAKMTVSGSRVGGRREVREPAASIGLDKPGSAAPILLQELRFDETLTVHGLELSWLEVNDSRCPRDAVCVWEGEVGILLGVKDGKEDLGSFALTRHHDGDERARVRIGIHSNQENNCSSPDSRIGFGGAGSACGQDNNNTCGNTATCSGDAGNRNTKVFGYVLAR